jgi:Tfp pilus assembly major pilin PilA
MIVVGIMGLIALIGIPSIYQIAKKEGMRRAVTDMKDVINNARAKAILSGKEAQLKFYPTERRFEITGGTSAPANPDSAPAAPAEASASSSQNPISSGTLPEDVSFGMLVVDGVNYLESEWTRVRFFPNGTCDELRLVLEQPGTDVIRGLELETTTGFIKMTSNPSEIATWY